MRERRVEARRAAHEGAAKKHAVRGGAAAGVREHGRGARGRRGEDKVLKVEKVGRATREGAKADGGARSAAGRHLRAAQSAVAEREAHTARQRRTGRR